LPPPPVCSFIKSERTAKAEGTISASFFLLSLTFHTSSFL
jgi:hypothetical protein